MPTPVLTGRRETAMHAAAQPDLAAKDATAAGADPLPWSNQAVKPDRGDWEYLTRAVGAMRMRPTEPPETR